jgi:drug/metabolite transporter (DMT)-like permease
MEHLLYFLGRLKPTPTLQTFLTGWFSGFGFGVVACVALLLFTGLSLTQIAVATALMATLISCVVIPLRGR